MRNFLMLVSFLSFISACSSPKEKYTERRAEAKQEYEKELKQAEEDYKKEEVKDKKDEAEEMIDESQDLDVGKKKIEVE